MIYTEFNCDARGNYAPVQCPFGTQCYCTDTMGKKIDLFGTVPKEQKDQLHECQSQGPCHDEWLALNNLPPTSMIVVQKPECLADGTYAPKQCKGSVCHCASSDGKQLEDILVDISQSQDMDCQCARDKDEYKKTGLIGKMFYCDEKGNYKQEQGPQRRMSHHNKDNTAGACQRELESMGPNQGFGAHKPQCLDDGSYHPRQCRESFCYCVDSTGKIADKKYIANVGMANDMSCKCAREEADFGNTGMIGKSFNCDQLGNYGSYACVGSMCFCTDQNGNQIQSIPAVNITQLQTLSCYH